MVAFRFRLQPDHTPEQRFSEMRDMLLNSHRSFRMVKNKYENVLQHMDSGSLFLMETGYYPLLIYRWLSCLIYRAKRLLEVI